MKDILTADIIWLRINLCSKLQTCYFRRKELVLLRYNVEVKCKVVSH